MCRPHEFLKQVKLCDYFQFSHRKRAKLCKQLIGCALWIRNAFYMYFFLKHVIYVFICILNWILIIIPRKCTNSQSIEVLSWLYLRPLKRFKLFCLCIRNSMTEKAFQYFLTAIRPFYQWMHAMSGRLGIFCLCVI